MENERISATGGSQNVAERRVLVKKIQVGRPTVSDAAKVIFV